MSGAGRPGQGCIWARLAAWLPAWPMCVCVLHLFVFCERTAGWLGESLPNAPSGCLRTRRRHSFRPSVGGRSEGALPAPLPSPLPHAAPARLSAEHCPPRSLVSQSLGERWCADSSSGLGELLAAVEAGGRAAQVAVAAVSQWACGVNASGVAQYAGDSIMPAFVERPQLSDTGTAPRWVGAGADVKLVKGKERGSGLDSRHRRWPPTGKCACGQSLQAGIRCPAPPLQQPGVGSASLCVVTHACTPPQRPAPQVSPAPLSTPLRGAATLRRLLRQQTWRA